LHEVGVDGKGVDDLVFPGEAVRTGGVEEARVQAVAPGAVVEHVRAEEERLERCPKSLRPALGERRDGLDEGNVEGEVARSPVAPHSVEPDAR
jgi:hypothetical protein